MSFTAKVKQTGRIFEALDELDKNGIIRAFDAQKLEDGKLYSGYLYDTDATSEPAKFRYRSRATATFKADELELLPLPVLLKGTRRPSASRKG
jgi:hypothetical protein